MNNKPNNKQPNTSADGDSSINTKKGFLISLPSRNKKNTEAASGIVQAKTINSASSSSSNDANTPSFAKNEGKNPRFFKNSDRQRSDTSSDKKFKDEQQNKKKGKDKDFGGAKKPSAAQQNSDTPQALSKSEKNNRHEQSERPKQKNNKTAKPSELREKKTQQQSQQPQQEKAKSNLKQQNKKNNKNSDRPEQTRSEKKERDGRNEKNNRNDRGRNAKKDKRTEKRMPSLSPLSSDMMSFDRHTKDDILSFSEKNSSKREPSLEEKYKNAVPLAEQIALEEEKRRVKPRAFTVQKIDRTKTANALIADSSASSAETKTEDLSRSDSELPQVSYDEQNVSENPQEQQDIPSNLDFEVVGVRFREAGKIYYFDPDGKDIPFGTPVIVETSRGCEYGYTAISNRLVPHDSVVPPLKKLKRVATEQDTEKYLANKALETEAAQIFKNKVSELGLQMNLVFVEYTFDNSKLLFYFTAETRIDFRELVKELASVFRTRIELRQIGVRDEAKVLGGLGVCGRSICCNTFLGDFAQVSIKMAKDQGLSLNSAKISGACGKLMCCLRYEDKVYSEEMARTPKVGSIVETDEGKGVVTEANALKGMVKVRLDGLEDAPPKAFNRDDVKIVGFNKAAAANQENSDDLRELAALEDNDKHSDGI